MKLLLTQILHLMSIPLYYLLGHKKHQDVSKHNAKYTNKIYMFRPQ